MLTGCQVFQAPIPCYIQNGRQCFAWGQMVSSLQIDEHLKQKIRLNACNVGNYTMHIIRCCISKLAFSFVT